MAPPLNLNQLKILNKEFYEKNNLFGRDKLFTLLKQKYENEAPSRRQIGDWLKSQEINQLYTPSKGKPKDIKSSITTPHKILAIDLLDLQNLR